MLLSLLKQKAKKDDDDGLGMYSGVLSNKGVYIDAVKFDVFRLLMIPQPAQAGCSPCLVGGCMRACA